jgi:hypothetical protein
VGQDHAVVSQGAVPTWLVVTEAPTKNMNVLEPRQVTEPQKNDTVRGGVSHDMNRSCAVSYERYGIRDNE